MLYLVEFHHAKYYNFSKSNSNQGRLKLRKSLCVEILFKNITEVLAKCGIFLVERRRHIRTKVGLDNMHKNNAYKIYKINKIHMVIDIVQLE